MHSSPSRRDELEVRAGAGRVSDGHGDLRAEHVLLERGVEVVDCLEFDPALRVADAGCDLAFLTMDLEALGFSDAARSVLAGYRAAGGDPGDDELVAFFAGYRALVRAKVALIRAEQSDDRQRLDRRPIAAGPRRAARMAREAAGARRRGRALGERQDPARLPALHALGPAPRQLRRGSQGPARHRAGRACRARQPTARASTAAPTRSSAAARRELQGASGVVVDATFRCAADRSTFRAALGDLPAGSVVECRAPLGPIRSALVAGPATRPPSRTLTRMWCAARPRTVALAMTSRPTAMSSCARTASRQTRSTTSPRS